MEFQQMSNFSLTQFVILLFVYQRQLVSHVYLSEKMIKFNDAQL